MEAAVRRTHKPSIKSWESPLQNMSFFVSISPPLPRRKRTQIGRDTGLKMTYYGGDDSKFLIRSVSATEDTQFTFHQNSVQFKTLFLSFRWYIFDQMVVANDFPEQGNTRGTQRVILTEKIQYGLLLRVLFGRNLRKKPWRTFGESLKILNKSPWIIF